MDPLTMIVAAGVAYLWSQSGTTGDASPGEHQSKGGDLGPLPPQTPGTSPKPKPATGQCIVGMTNSIPPHYIYGPCPANKTGPLGPPDKVRFRIPRTWTPIAGSQPFTGISANGAHIAQALVGAPYPQGRA